MRRRRRRFNVSGVLVLSNPPAGAWKGMTSTPGMQAAVTDTLGPSMVCPRPPMHPVTTPPIRALALLPALAQLQHLRVSQVLSQNKTTQVELKGNGVEGPS